MGMYYIFSFFVLILYYIAYFYFIIYILVVSPNCCFGKCCIPCPLMCIAMSPSPYACFLAYILCAAALYASVFHAFLFKLISRNTNDHKFHCF
uniref:Uncharacterized protein n=1 Tax=Triticum urartu TaxID=4572 RepID=A0A8R7QBN7_TRIUA